MSERRDGPYGADARAVWSCTRCDWKGAEEDGLQHVQDHRSGRTPSATTTPEEGQVSVFGPDDLDLLGPPYTPVERVDVLVRCNRCGAVVDGNVLGQNQHDIWHSSFDRRIEQAGRWKPAPRYK